MAMPRKAPIERECSICGKPFLVGPHGYGYSGWSALRCSTACRNVGRVRKSAGSLVLSPTDAAYMAGLVDGEGSLSIRTRTVGSLVLQLSITNTCREVLEWCRDVTGIGAVVKSSPDATRRRQCWYWSTPCGSAATVLRQIRPYMKIKVEQADIAIELQERLRVPALKADRSWQLEWRARMQALNKRGPRAEPD